jgi:hypothetical protein
MREAYSAAVDDARSTDEYMPGLPRLPEEELNKLIQGAINRDFTSSRTFLSTTSTTQTLACTRAMRVQCQIDQTRVRSTELAHSSLNFASRVETGLADFRDLEP